jgi:hypothetical protein
MNSSMGSRGFLDEQTVDLQDSMDRVNRAHPGDSSWNLIVHELAVLASIAKLGDSTEFTRS